MIILTNCLTDIVDEGGLKVATHLAKCIKAKRPSTTLISCGRDAAGADVHFKVNRLMINPRLWRFLRRSGENILYIPAFARMLPTALRIFVLSMVTRRRLRTLLVMKTPINFAAKILLLLSGVELVVLSENTRVHYESVLGSRVVNLQTGVDTSRFVPVDDEQKNQIRERLGIPKEQTVVLHIGHLTEGRNIRELLKLKNVHIVVVASSFKLNVKDEALRKELLSRHDVTLIETYVPHIEEICQMADVYFFPVVKECNCIDVPLSVLETAACGKPVVTTDYGEMRTLVKQPGFYLIERFEAEHLNMLVQRAVSERINPRNAVMPYDWSNAVKKLLQN